MCHLKVITSVGIPMGFQTTGNLDVGTVNGVSYSSVLERGIHPTLLGQHAQQRNVSMTNDFFVNGTMDVESALINNKNFVELLSDVIYSVKILQSFLSRFNCFFAHFKNPGDSPDLKIRDFINA